MPADASLVIPPRPEVLLGVGVAGELPELVERVGERTAFVVTDHGLTASGVVERVVRRLERGGIRTAVYDGVEPNPGGAQVEAGARALRAFGPAAVVAVGGGSPIDAAKAMALLAANDLPLERLAAAPGDLAPAAPIIGVPTTAGTGSETNGFGVIDDPGARRKRYLGHPSASPRYAVLDPSLTVSAPPGVTAACGIDVLAHALESMQARVGNPYSAALASEAIRLVVGNLPAVVHDGGDVEGRTAMLLAAHLAGLAFATTGLGTAHAIGHALSARHGTPHGVALAAVLPLVVAANARDRPAETARAAEAAGVAGGPDALPGAIAALQEAIGLRPSLGELGVARAELGELADAALADAVLLNAPRRPARHELVSLLTTALDGGDAESRLLSTGASGLARATSG